MVGIQYALNGKPHPGGPNEMSPMGIPGGICGAGPVRILRHGEVGRAYNNQCPDRGTAALDSVPSYSHTQSENPRIFPLAEGDEPT